MSKHNFFYGCIVRGPSKRNKGNRGKLEGINTFADSFKRNQPNHVMIFFRERAAIQRSARKIGTKSRNQEPPNLMIIRVGFLAVARNRNVVRDTWHIIKKHQKEVMAVSTFPFSSFLSFLPLTHFPLSWWWSATGRAGGQAVKVGGCFEESLFMSVVSHNLGLIGTCII